MLHRLSTAKLASIAVVLGLMAGAGAVYVKGAASGNDQVTPMAETPNVTTASIEPGACEADAARIDALSELATGQVAAMAPREEPVSVEALSFMGPGGDAMTLADFSDSVVLVNLWATWCAPCREEMPDLARLQEEAGASDEFEVVTINVDTGDDAKPRAFLEEIGVDNLTLYRDASMDVFNALKSEGLAFGLPVTLLVGRDGCLMAAMNGPAAWASEDAFRLVEGAVGL